MKWRENARIFSSNVTFRPQQYKKLFKLLDEAAVTATGGVGLWMGENVGEIYNIRNVFRYLAESMRPTPRLHSGFDRTAEEIRLTKDLLVNTKMFAVPEDLSKFYKTLRDESGGMFGDVVANAVSDMYEVQDPQNTSLLSQVAYSACVRLKSA